MLAVLNKVSPELFLPSEKFNTKVRTIHKTHVPPLILLFLLPGLSIALTYIPSFCLIIRNNKPTILKLLKLPTSQENLVNLYLPACSHTGAVLSFEQCGTCTQSLSMIVLPGLPYFTSFSL
jgi:hypothetical protein